MKSYETSATVAEHGALQLGGLPFPAGTRVEVSISPKVGLPCSKQAAYDELDELDDEEDLEDEFDDFDDDEFDDEEDEYEDDDDDDLDDDDDEDDDEDDDY